MKVEINEKTVSQIVGLISKDNLVKYIKEVLKNEERSYRSESVLEYLLGTKPFKTVADFPINEEMAKEIAKTVWKEDCKPETIKLTDVINIEQSIIFSYKTLDDRDATGQISVYWYEEHKC